jgi:phage regulator Rha-like protein
MSDEKEQEIMNTNRDPESMNDLVTINNGRPVTTSLRVAEYFSKRHADVLRDIKALETPADFNERNFAG